MGWAGVRVRRRERRPQVQPEEAGGEMAPGLGGEWGGGVQEPPAPNHSSHHKPHWAGRGQGGTGPLLVRVRSQCVQISKKEGCGAAAPTSPPPHQTGSRSRGRGQRQYCFSHHAWRRWVMGQEEEGWIRGVSRAPCPLPPWRLRWQDSEACGGPGTANPHRGQTLPGCSPIRAGSSLRRSPGPGLFGHLDTRTVLFAF